MASIYGLLDSDGNLRYIGKANDPSKRLSSHMRDSRRRATPLYSWIRKHGRPKMVILEEDCPDWREAEIRLIAEARARGEDLLNLADGGDEPKCPSETRALNGKAVAAAIHGDPIRRQLWNMHHRLGLLLKQGHVSKQTRDKMKQRPDLFGAWAHLL